MRDETAKDNRQSAEWINHDLTRNNELAFFFQEESLILLFLNTEIFLFLFQRCCHQIIDMNDIFRKSEVNQEGRIRHS